MYDETNFFKYENFRRRLILVIEDSLCFNFNYRYLSNALNRSNSKDCSLAIKAYKRTKKELIL